MGVHPHNPHKKALIGIDREAKVLTLYRRPRGEDHFIGVGERLGYKVVTRYGMVPK